MNAIVAADLLPIIFNEISSGKKPVRYPIGVGDFSKINIGPGIVTILGAPPAWGKTILAMQMLFYALANTPHLRAIVANVETRPIDLLERQIAQFSSLPASEIRERDNLSSEKIDQIKKAIDGMTNICQRLYFLKPPFNTEAVYKAAQEFNAGFVILDYLQRFEPSPPAKGQRPAIDLRQKINAVMDDCRFMASNLPAAVLAISSVGRGMNYSNLSMASMKESGEIEYGADDIFVLKPADENHKSSKPPENGMVMLCHEKARWGSIADIPLCFDAKTLQFKTFEGEIGGAHE